MKNLKLSITLCLLLSSYYSRAQDSEEGFGSRKYIEFMSPQAGSMLRFDNVEPISNDGSPLVKVPLFSIDDSDFYLSAYLQYNSNGFKPGNNDNYVGRDWSLMTGGVIYREVKGMPDDHVKAQGRSSMDGFLVNAKDLLLDDQLFRNALLNDTPNNVYRNILDSSGIGDMNFKIKDLETSREINSDIYHFSFGNHSGKFMINFDGTVNVVSYTGGSYEVDISNYKNIDDNKRDNFDSSITIRTDDGYSYKFGGNLASVEYNIHSWADYYLRPLNGASRSDMIISAMHLTEIKSPNRRAVTYRYMDNVDKKFTSILENMLSVNTYDELLAKNAHLNCILNVSAGHNDYNPYVPILLLASELKVDVPKWAEWLFKLFPYSLFDLLLNPKYGGVMVGWIADTPLELYIARMRPSGMSDGPNVIKQFNLSKAALLLEIETDNNKIIFNYGERESPYITDDNTAQGATIFGAACGARMTSVEVYESSNLLDRTYLEYEYRGPRMFLKSVRSPHIGKYTFLYNNGSATNVKPYTAHLDHWGFYNQVLLSPEPTGLVPNCGLSPTSQEQTVTGSLRSPHVDNCYINMLSEVYFPTGGSMSLQYEPHTYSSAITQIEADAYKKTLRPNEDIINRPAGGARLKSVSYYSTDSKLAKSVSYRYTKDIKSPESSGILMHMPHYMHNEKLLVFYPGGPEPTFDLPPMVYKNAQGVNIAPKGNHVQYSKITELYMNENLTMMLGDSTRLFTVDYFDPLSQFSLGVDSFRSLPSNVLGHLTRDELTELERKYGQWEIKGQGGQATSGGAKHSAKVSIKKGSVTVWEHTFQKSLAENENFVFNPYHKFGPGTYNVVMTIDGNNARAEFKIKYPGTASPMVNPVYKEMVFSDYETNPDVLGKEVFYETYPYMGASLEDMIDLNRDLDYFKWMRAELGDMSHERGKILRETYYAGYDNIEKDIIYRYEKKGGDKYNILISSPALYNTSFHLFYRPVKVPMNSYHMVEKKITEYREGEPATFTENYEIDDDGYLDRVINITSKGDTLSTEYIRLKDIESSPSGFGGLVGDVKEWLVAGGDEKLLSQISIRYGANTGKVASKEVSYTEDIVANYERYIYTDTYGNPVLISKNGVDDEIVIWGHNGSRPIAIIKNAEYDEVKSILGHSRIIDNPRNYYSQISVEELNSLRTHLPNAHITTIEYNELRQPTVITDPAGIKKCYRYTNNRLSMVFQKDGYKETILESYEYNFDVN